MSNRATGTAKTLKKYLEPLGGQTVKITELKHVVSEVLGFPVNADAIKSSMNYMSTPNTSYSNIIQVDARKVSPISWLLGPKPVLNDLGWGNGVLTKAATATAIPAALGVRPGITAPTERDRVAEGDTIHVDYIGSLVASGDMLVNWNGVTYRMRRA